MKDDIRNAVPPIAAALAEKAGVKVIVEGKEAYNNGEVICIPDIDCSSNLERNALLGYVAHEAAHTKYESFSALDERRKLKNISSFEHKLFNIIEDIRIEKRIALDLVGTKLWLDSIVTLLIEEGEIGFPTSHDSPDKVFSDFILLWGSFEFLNQKELSEYSYYSEKAFDQVFRDQTLKNDIKNLLFRKIPKMKDSFSAFDIVDDLIEMLNNKKDDNDSNDDSSGSKGEQSSGFDGEQSSGGDGGQSSGSKDEQSSGSKDEQSSGSKDEQSSGGKDEQSSGFDGEQSSRSKAICEALNGDSHYESHGSKLEGLLSGKASEKHSLTCFPRGVDVCLYESEEKNDMARELLLDSIAVSAKISSCLISIAETLSRGKKRYRERGLKLSSNRTYRLGLPEPVSKNVFVKKRKGKSIDAVFEILVDKSLSMHGHFNYISDRSVLSIVNALERINGVDVGVTSFPYFDSGTVCKLLEFNESAKDLHKKLVSNQALGRSTPSDEGILYSSYKILKSRRSKKVIMMLTDGDPTSPKKTIEMVRRCRESGITLVTFVIVPKDVDLELFSLDFIEIYGDPIFIRDIEDLKGELFKKSRDILEF